MQRRRDNGLLATHGGAVEIGETVEDAARRELLEETGLTANAMTLLGVFSGPERLYEYPNGDLIYTVGIKYLCEDFSGDPSADEEETLGLKWFEIENIPEDVTPPDRPVLEAFVEWFHTCGK